MKLKLTREQRKALEAYNYALAQEDRYLGSVFVNAHGQRKVEAPTEAQRNSDLEALGFKLNISSGPRGEVGDNDWPCIAFDVSLEFKGRVILSTPYKLGVGHVKPLKMYTGSVIPNWPHEERAFLEAWQGNPSANFKNKALWCRVAAKLAKAQKVTPSLPCVLNSLLSDGSAFFNAQTFEDWAYEYGYNADSREAEAIFRTCDDIGRRLASGVPKEALDKAREILADY